MRLYDLIPAYQSVADELENAESAEQVQMLLDTLESIDAAIEVKMDGYCKIVAMFQHYADIRKAEAERLESSALSAINTANKLRARMMGALDAIGRTEVKSDLFTVRIQENPVSVDVHDPDAIPDEFKRTKTQVTISPDRIAIKKAIESGQYVPGAALMRTRKLVLK